MLHSWKQSYNIYVWTDTTVCDCCCLPTLYKHKTKQRFQLTTIRTIMHPKPSELGSQAGVGESSTMEGDHMGTVRVVSFLFLFDSIHYAFVKNSRFGTILSMVYFDR